MAKQIGIGFPSLRKKTFQSIEQSEYLYIVIFIVFIYSMRFKGESVLNAPMQNAPMITNIANLSINSDGLLHKWKWK